jgi:hypothetical protein
MIAGPVMAFVVALSSEELENSQSAEQKDDADQHQCHGLFQEVHTVVLAIDLPGPSLPD